MLAWAVGATGVFRTDGTLGFIVILTVVVFGGEVGLEAPPWVSVRA